MLTKSRVIQQQQQHKSHDSQIIKTNIDGTNCNTRHNNNYSQKIDLACDDGSISIDSNTTKTATILVSKTKAKTGLPLLMKNSNK